MVRRVSGSPKSSNDPAAMSSSDTAAAPLARLASLHRRQKRGSCSGGAIQNNAAAQQLTQQHNVWASGGLGMAKESKSFKNKTGENSSTAPTAFLRGRAPAASKTLFDGEDEHLTEPSGCWKYILPRRKKIDEEPSLEELHDMDKRRKRVLAMSRQLSPIDSVAWVSLLRHTAIPRIHRRYATWAVYLGFLFFATLSRSGVWSVSDFDPDIVEGGTTVVTFMITFYVSYCYNRYATQFADTELLMRSIINACKYARVYFSDPDEVHRLWRYLNLQHCIAYCGLTVGP